MTRREAHGIPTVYVCNSTYASVSQFSNEDSGMPNARRVVMDHISNFREYATHIPLRGQMVAGNAGTRVMYWYDNIVNRQQSFTPDVLREYWGFADPIMATWTPAEQARWALGVYGANAPMASCGTRSLDGRLTEHERNPGITDPARLGDMDRPADRLTHRASTFTISGVNYEDAVRNFNRLAVHRDGRQGTAFNTTFVPPAFPGVQHNPEVFAFGDGLELIPPTRALVDEMLAYTDRAPDEIVGKMRKRAGIMTVEKIAINAVMAGARPEYFPVILAAMEAYAGGYTYGMMFHHAFSTGGPYGFVMVLAGPIVEELGILDDGRSGTSGAGNQTLNTIGRAVRMCIRNIGHNRVPDVDTTGRIGKRNDHVIDFYAENMSALPEGWRPHSEMMGFPEGSSTISMKEFNTIFSLREFGQFAAEPFAWTTSEALAQLRSRIAGGFSNIILIPPALAAELQYEGVSTMEDLKVALRPAATGAGANTFNFWPIVVGTDPGVHRTYTLDTAAHTTYVTNLIVGPSGPIAPSAPTNFNVEFSPDRTSATLTWDVPDRIGGAPIIAFDVSGVHGLTTVFTPPNAEDFVNNGLPNITAAMLAGSGQFQGMSLTRLPATARSHTFYNLEPDSQGFFMVRAVNGVRNNAGIQGMANNLSAVYAPDAFNLRESGVGSWAHFAEAPIDLVTGNNGLGRRDPNGPARGALGTPRHFRADWFDHNVYYPLATLVRAPVAGYIEPVTPDSALFDTLLDDGFVSGNQITALRAQLEAIADEHPAYIALTYNSRWFSHLRDGRGRLEVTITSENADASNAFVLAHCRISDTTKAINEAGFTGGIDGLNSRGMVGTGAVANWPVNTGVFNHANYAFFATEPGTYRVTFTLRDVQNDINLVSEYVDVVVYGEVAAPAQFSLRAFNNGTCAEVPSLAGIIRIWPQLNDVGVPMPMNAVITAVDQGNQDAMEFITRNRQWIEGEGWQDYYLNFDVNKDAPWQYIDLTITAFGQTVILRLVNNLFVSDVLGLVAFNNGTCTQVPSLAGTIRIWPQFNDVSAPLTMNATITAVDQNGDDAMQFVTRNRQWVAGSGWQNYYMNFDVNKNAQWQYIYFTVAAFGQSVTVRLINNLYVPAPIDVFGLQAFNNGNNNNASLANAGIIRIWTQLNGANAPVSFENLTVTALDQSGIDAMQFVRVNRIWNNLDYVNLIDVTKQDANWQYIYLTVTLGTQVVELRLINNTF